MNSSLFKLFLKKSRVRNAVRHSNDEVGECSVFCSVHCTRSMHRRNLVTSRKLAEYDKQANVEKKFDINARYARVCR